MDRPLLNIKNIHMAYGDNEIINNLSLELEQGEFIGLVGPNGAGKTTFLSAMGGQFKPFRGTINHFQENIYINNKPYKAKIGYVNESPFFYEYLTIEDTFRFIGKIKYIKNKLLEHQISEILDLIQLKDERFSYISQLSMGMKKRLAIGTALLGNPEIIFLDEAFVNIDFTSLHAIKTYLKEYTSRGGTVILSTHILETVEKICSRILFLSDGKILKDISADELKLILSSESPDLESFLINLKR